MAKRKTPKVKDLRPGKITNKQLENVQQVINSINRIQMDVGNLESQKHNLLHTMAGLNDQLTIIRDEFEKDYGTTDINIQTGEIKYPENGETDKKD
jgi:FtsZ-binding cell division protein ZapB